MSALVQAFGLSKFYDVGRGALFRRARPTLRAVDSVDLDIDAGETLGLVGESGCGKSTLGRLLIRLIPSTSGRVVFDGLDITGLNAKSLRAARRSMQIVFQDPFGSLDPRMAVEDAVMEPLLIHGVRKAADARLAVARMFDMVGLPASALRRFPHEFFGGQRQRIGIARALILRPRFVVCDEPVSALDVSIQAQIVNLLSDLQAELGLTYLFIAHDLGVVKHISDRVAVMYLGKVVEVADKHALYAHPRHPYTQALLASTPITHPSQRKRGSAKPPLTGEIPTALDLVPGCRFHTRCPHVMAVCKVVEPVMHAAGARHLAACHLVTPAQGK